jgi:type VI secretion system protein
MPLTIKVISYKGQCLVDQLEGSFDQDGGTLGRLPENRSNHLTLPDPDKYISRKHAFIKYENGCYYLTDTSMDGTYILNRNLRIYRDTVRLSDGDKLRIGDYDLIVHISSREVFENAPLTSVDSREENPPFLEFDREKRMQLEPAREQYSLAGNDFLWPQGDIFEQKPEQNRAAGHIQQSPLHDSFSLPDIGADTEQTREIPKSFNFEELINDLDETGGAPALPKSNEVTEPEDMSRETPVDTRNEPSFDDRFDGAHPGRRENVVPIPGRLAGNATPAVSDKIQRIRQQAYSELFEVFLEAAGVKDTSFLRREEIPKLMQTVGIVFREMIDGLMTILRGRSELKSQFRVSATILKPGDNNPLKFSRIVDDALKQLLTKDQPGFVDAIDAVREGYADIMNHQLAMTAGIQAAIIRLLDRFDPQHFAKPYEEGVIFQRKAKSWDAYRQSYSQIADEAMEKFFGESFARAYEEQIRKLRPKKTNNE